MSFISTWLQSIELLEYLDLFTAQGFNTSISLMNLTQDDLKELGIVKLGHIKSILNASSLIQMPVVAPVVPVAPIVAAEPVDEPPSLEEIPESFEKEMESWLQDVCEHAQKTKRSKETKTWEMVSSLLSRCYSFMLDKLYTIIWTKVGPSHKLGYHKKVQKKAVIEDLIKRWKTVTTADVAYQCVQDLTQNTKIDQRNHSADLCVEGVSTFREEKIEIKYW